MATKSEKLSINLCPGTTFSINSPAKINLTLDILGRDTNGYHFVDTILQEIELADELIFKSNPRSQATPGIILECSDPSIPTDENNTIHKAISLLQPYSPDSTGLHVTLKKNIPVSGGLGGGSSNAAATLKALNQLWDLNLSNTQLRRLGTQIGIDVPFFVEGGTALGTHYGEQITNLPAFKMPPHLIIVDDEKLSTKEAYKSLDLSKTGKNSEKTQQFIESLQNQAPGSADPGGPDRFHNDFEQLISQKTLSLKKKLLQLGATLVHISGSGPALYALFSSTNQKHQAYQELKGKVRFIWESAQ